MRRRLLALSCALAGLALAQDAGPLPAAPEPHYTRFANGDGPSLADGVFRLLDASGTRGQSNALAFDRTLEGAFEKTSLTCRLRVLEGGDGGAFVFLNTAEYGARGPAPFLKSWVEPNLSRTFSVGTSARSRCTGTEERSSSGWRPRSSAATGPTATSRCAT